MKIPLTRASDRNSLDKRNDQDEVQNMCWFCLKHVSLDII